MTERARIAALLPERLDALLVAGGDAPARWQLEISASRSVNVVAIDGGLRHLRKLDICPQIVIGDLDSALPADITWARRRRAHVLLRAEQESSDLDKALHLCREKKWRNIALACVDGERADHFLYALSRSAKLRGVQVTLLLRRAVAFPLNGRVRREIRLGTGRTFSWFALPQAGQATLTNAEWPFRNRSLIIGEFQSLSNCSSDESIIVEQRSGRSLVIIPIGKV